MTRRHPFPVAALLVAAACGPATSEQAAPPEETATSLPATDLTMAIVPLEDVWFDTFDGGAVSLADADPGLIADLRDRIPPIEEPVYTSADEANWLHDDDLVIAYVDADGQPWAWPVRILNFHEIVNEQLAGSPVLVSWCPLCGSGVLYDRRLGDRTLTFGNTSALYESDLVMYDHQTNSYWWQVAGRAIIGTLSGQELTPLPSSTTTWGGWRAENPDTRVLARPGGRASPYDRDPFVSLPGRLDGGQFPFPVGDDARDPRLAPSTRVLGLVVDGQARAYPLEALAGQTIEDDLGGRTVVVEVDATGVSATVSLVTADGDRRPLGSRTSFWFAFVAAFPDASVYEAS